MGSYTNGLFKRKTKKTARVVPDLYLVGCAILREGDLFTAGGNAKTHSAVRESMGDENPYESKRIDQEGFMTNEGFYVSRRAAAGIASAAGQGDVGGRELLSSDILWWTPTARI